MSLSTLAMTPGAQPPGGMPTSQGYPSHNFDTTGQVAPAGMKPRVTATLWEDEGSLCFQVEAKGVCVARREGMYNILPDRELGDPLLAYKRDNGRLTRHR